MARWAGRRVVRCLARQRQRSRDSGLDIDLLPSSSPFPGPPIPHPVPPLRPLLSPVHLQPDPDQSRPVVSSLLSSSKISLSLSSSLSRCADICTLQQLQGEGSDFAEATGGCNLSCIGSQGEGKVSLSCLPACLSACGEWSLLHLSGARHSKNVSSGSAVRSPRPLQG